MNINKIDLVYFSATGTTQKTLRYMTEEMGAGKVEEYNITQARLNDLPDYVIQAGAAADMVFTANDLVVFGIPVYSGRVPAIAVDALNRFKGSQTPAIVVCVYGNREFDDALLELKDIVEANNFKVFVAGAFLAEHSIFPAVANGRPDSRDKLAIVEFGKKCAELLLGLDRTALPEIKVKGNSPYREAGNIPFAPKGDSKCDECGTCVKSCPAKAIDAAHPRKTDKKICIACARCIKVCPQDARHFGGLLYKMVRRKFQRAYSERKEPEVFFAKR